MKGINTERMTADIDGDFVVFLIGMRINKFWKVHKWLPVFLGMPRMLKELERETDSGLLGYETRLGLRNQMVVQYWRSFEHLREYAFDHEKLHVPAWASFNREVGDSGDVGIWHETYLVDAGRYEGIYHNVPPYGLGRASNLVPARDRRKTAAGRLGLTGGEDAPVDEDGNIDVELAPPGDAESPRSYRSP